jgi:hypothetical protein
MLVCKLCEAELEGEHWKCTDASCGQALCNGCFYEEGHNEAHKVRQVKGSMLDRPLFSYEDPITGNRLFLGNYVAALPGSATIEDNKISCVLTLIQLGDKDDPLFEEMQTLAAVYKEKSTVKVNDAVMYHVIPMPDVISPQALPAGLQPLEEGTCFIDAGLQKGNVLVHCQVSLICLFVFVLMLIKMLERGEALSDAVSGLDVNAGIEDERSN